MLTALSWCSLQPALRLSMSSLARVHHYRVDVVHGKAYLYCQWCGVVREQGSDGSPGCTPLTATLLDSAEVLHSVMDQCAKLRRAVDAAGGHAEGRPSAQVHLPPAYQQLQVVEPASVRPEHRVAPAPTVPACAEEGVRCAGSAVTDCFRGHVVSTVLSDAYVDVENTTNRTVYLALAADPNLLINTQSDGHLQPGMGGVEMGRATTHVFAPEVGKEIKSIAAGGKARMHLIAGSSQSFLTAAFRSSRGGFRLLFHNQPVQPMSKLALLPRHLENALDCWLDKWEA